MLTEAALISLNEARATIDTAQMPHRPQLVKGFMQLYSVTQKRSQALEAHAAAFSTLKVRRVHLILRKCCRGAVVLPPYKTPGQRLVP